MAKELFERLSDIVSKSINEMARAKIQRTIDAKLWASVSSSISKKYKNDMGASAKPGATDCETLTAKLVAALLIMKQPCPKSYWDIKVFRQWAEHLRKGHVPIERIIQLYNENSGGKVYEVFSVSAVLHVGYNNCRFVDNELASYERLTAPSADVAIKASLTKFWTGDSQKWCRDMKSWNSYEPELRIDIRDSDRSCVAKITCQAGKEPNIERFDNKKTVRPVQKAPEPELAKWTIQYEYRDGAEMDIAKCWVSASNEMEARSEFRDEHPRGRIIRIWKN